MKFCKSFRELMGDEARQIRGGSIGGVAGWKQA